MPGVYLCMTYWRNDLFGLYTGMAIGYAVLVVLYSYMAFTRLVVLRLSRNCRMCSCSLASSMIMLLHSDWKKYAELARLRSESSLGASEE